MNQYSPLTFTIPADGETITIQATGRSFKVTRSNIYSSGQYPAFSFGSQITSGAVELTPQSTFNANGEKFDKITVQGTSESAGETVDLLIMNECALTQINDNILTTPRVTAGTSLFISISADTVQTLTALQLQDSDGNLPRKIYISCRGANIAYAFGVDPTQSASGSAGNGTILTEEKDPLEIDGNSFMTGTNGIRFRPAVSTETGTLTIHKEF